MERFWICKKYYRVIYNSWYFLLLLNVSFSEKEIKLTSLKLTAIRETFEEAGILLSKPQISLSGTEVKEWREKLEKRPEGFMEMCKYYDVSPDIDSLYYVSHWIPPTVVNKKFSTFFFAYLAPNPIVFHPPNTKGSQRELTSLEYKTPSKWLKLQRDEVIFFPPQFYTCSVLANSFPTWSAIESHLKTPPIGEHKTMASIIQLVDESKVDLKAFGVDPNNCDSVYYQIYPGDSQYNKDLDDVDYEPLLNNGKLNQNVKYHRILGIIEGLQLRDIKLITNLNVNKGRFLVYDDTSNFSSNKAKL